MRGTHLTIKEAIWFIAGLASFTAVIAAWIYLAAPTSVR